MQPVNRVDATWADLLRMGAACMLAWRRRALAARLERRCGPRSIAFAALGDAFDAAIAAVDAGRDDEVVLVGLVREGLERQARARGLVVRGADIDPVTLNPDGPSLRQAMGGRTRAVVVAHPFGGRCDLREASAIAREHGAALIVDGTRALAAPGDRLEEHSDVTLIGLGTGATASACGGAIAHVRDSQVAGRMRSLRSSWPVQRRRARVRQVVGGLASRVRAAASASGFATTSSPGSGLDELAPRACEQPSAPLLWAMLDRLSRFPVERVACRVLIGRRIGRAAPALLHVGAGAADHAHWAVALASFKPEVLCEHLNTHGFEAMQASDCGLIAVEGAPRARALLRSMVLVPSQPELGAVESRRLEGLLQAWREFDVIDLDVLRHHPAGVRQVTGNA